MLIKQCYYYYSFWYKLADNENNIERRERGKKLELLFSKWFGFNPTLIQSGPKTSWICIAVILNIDIRQQVIILNFKVIIKSSTIILCFIFQYQTVWPGKKGIPGSIKTTLRISLNKENELKVQARIETHLVRRIGGLVRVLGVHVSLKKERSLLTSFQHIIKSIHLILHLNLNSSKKNIQTFLPILSQTLV